MKARRLVSCVLLALAWTGGLAAPALADVDPSQPVGEPRGPGDLKTFFKGGRLSVGGAIPVGDARFGAPSGREFKPGLAVHGDLALDIGSHVQLGLSICAELFTMNAEAYKTGGSNGHTYYAIPRVHVYPYAFGWFRPYVGVGGGYAAASLTRPSCNVFNCSSVDVVKYSGVVLNIAGGLRYDFRIFNAYSDQPRLLVPVTAELSYDKNFWTSTKVTIPGSTLPSDARPHYDQIILTVGAGVMF